MEWTNISELIDARLIVVVAACWVCGYILKQTPKVPNWTIIYSVTTIALVLTIWMLGWSPESLIQGILAGAFAVYGNQIIQQTARGVDQK